MRNIIFGLILLFAIGCGKDSIDPKDRILENETISGQVSYSPLEICCPDVRVSVLQIIDSTEIVVLATVNTDMEGKYVFDNITPEQDNLYITLDRSPLILRAEDDTPDGDEGEVGQTMIGVYLEEDEHDDGNNFEILNESLCTQRVSGNLFQVEGQDTMPLQSPVTVHLYTADALLQPLDLVESKEVTTSYFFNLEEEFGGIVVLDYTTGPIPLQPIAISSIDESPDNDVVNGVEINHIPVNLDSCETDSDNNFYLFFNENIASVRGRVLLDEDFNGSGDSPLRNKRVELYHRSSDNVPMIPLVGAINSGDDGVFEFFDVPAGEYILYYIGDGQHEIKFGFDEDQEIGEPSSPEPQFIPVNVSGLDETDDNNVFILVTSAGCNASPIVAPYPALCDTALVCTYDRLPIYATDQAGEPLTSAGGVFSLLWTDLVTGESMLGDWTWNPTNHPMQLDITYPDGCTYTVLYHRDCPQDLQGTLSLRTMTTGFGPTYEYELDEVIWAFDPFDRKLRITHNIINNLGNPNLIPAGMYNYELIIVADELELVVVAETSGTTYNLGAVKFVNGQILIDDDIAADGVGRFFDKY